METIEKQAFKVKELLNTLGYNDIAIEGQIDNSCEWRPTKKINITSPGSSLEISHKNSSWKPCWEFSFNGSFFKASDNLFQLFVKNIVFHLSKNKQSSNIILAELGEEMEITEIETIDFFLDSAREIFGKLRIEETRMKICADDFVAIYGKSMDDEVEFSVFLDLNGDNPDNTELEVCLQTQVFSCSLKRNLSKTMDKSDLSQALADVKRALSAFNDICTQLEDESNYSLSLVESPSAETTPLWVLDNFRENMAVYGNAVLPFQAGISSRPEYLSDKHGKFIEFSSKVGCLKEIVEGFPDAQWRVEILQDCFC